MPSPTASDQLAPLSAALRAETETLYRANPHTTGTSIALAEALVLAQVIASAQPAATLEVGLAHAGSTIAIAAARRACNLHGQHIALDPYQATHSSSVGLQEIAKQDLQAHVQWIADWSEHYLPQCIERQQRFDFIMIDGGHGLGQAVVDAYFADKVLHPGGYLCIHDSYLTTTAASLHYLTHECGYLPVMCRTHPLTLYERVRKIRVQLRLGQYFNGRLFDCSVANLAVLRKQADYRGGYA